jgi:PHD/YefM family antitoxin component YafN of YafNO toxin-antitoxin module
VTELPTLEEVHAFLLGTGSIDGKWFGEGESGRPDWWRKLLREAIASRPTPDLGKDEELVERLTYLIQFHVYAEAEARDVQCVIDSLSERDGWTASGGWIIVKEDDWNNSQDRLEALHAEREKLRERMRLIEFDATNTVRQALGCSGSLTMPAQPSVGRTVLMPPDDLSRERVLDEIQRRIVIHRRTMNEENNEPALRYMAAGAFEALRELRSALRNREADAEPGSR